MNKSSLWIFLFTLIQKGFNIQFELRTKAPPINAANNLKSFLGTDITTNTGNAKTIKICIGEPNQCFDMLYDTASHFTWVGSSQLIPQVSRIYNPAKSNTGSSLKNKLHLKDMYGLEFTNYIHFSSGGMLKAKKPFNLFLVDQVDQNGRLPYDGVLGLNRRYSEEQIRIEKSQWVEARIKYSFMDYLLKNDVINQTIFAHKMFKTKSGVLYMGESGTTEPYYPTCNSQSSRSFLESFYSSYWHCTSTNIYDSLYNQRILFDYQKLQIVFDSGLDLIVGPEEETNIIFKYIESHSKKTSCKRREDIGVGIFLECYDLDVSSVPHLSFEIENKVNITFTGEDLFAKETQQNNGQQQVFKSKIIFNSLITRSIVFGVIGLEKYHMIFNSNDNTIGFLPLKEDELLIEDILRIKSKLKFIIRLFVITMIIFISLEVFFLIKGKKVIFLH